MPRRYLDFWPGGFYHLYNRGVNRGEIFFTQENYDFFLFNLDRYLLDTVNLSAFCLMPNHYHLLVLVKGTSGVLKTPEVAFAMMRLSVSYTKAINCRFDRVGPLFQGPYQAKEVGSLDYLWDLIQYIHYNPVEAGFVARPDLWEHSSYRLYQDLGMQDSLDLDLLSNLRGL